jgi:ESCRT-II complex subunit VPS36
MPQLRYWHSVEVSAGSRPTLREKEVDVLVEDSVGLYQGKSKIINRQNGRLYLTSQRLIYIDNRSPKDMSLSIELTDVKSIDFTPKFLRSSSKITIFFKTLKPSASKTQTTSRQTTWICPICSFSNDISTNLNYSNAQYIPVCQTCGVKPDVEVIQRAIEASRSNETQRDKPKVPLKQTECSACTFLNHPSMRNCEICGSILPMNAINEMSSDTREVFDDRIKIETETEDGLHEVYTPFIKLSFHKGGDKTFYDRLGQTLEKLQWDKLVQSGQVNRDVLVEQEQEQDLPGSKIMGLHRLTQLEENRTRKNEQIINSSLDDLQTLLAKANEIRGLIESFKRLETGDDASQAKIIPTINQVTQSILRDPSKEDQKRLYLQEISRQLSDFLITDKTLEQEGGIITLIDLYALYNRGRVGFNLISPEELYEACSYFDSLRLPLVLKRINKVLVVQDLKFTSNEALISDIERFIEIYGIEDLFKFKYCNILKASEYFNWSLTITEEILNIGLESGVLCVDQQITGRHFYLNEFMIKGEQYVAPREGQATEAIKEGAVKE